MGKLLAMLWSFVIGIVAGWIANLILRKGSYGVIANMLVGLIGALIGSWVAQMLSFDFISTFWLIISSIIGAVVALVAVAIVATRTKNGDE